MVALNKETVAVYLLDDDPSILKATRPASRFGGLEGQKLSLIQSHFWSMPRCIGPIWQSSTFLCRI